MFKGCSALMLAAYGGNEGIVKILLRWDADVNYHPGHLCTIPSVRNMIPPIAVMATPLGCAVAGGNLATVQIIMSA